MASIFISYRWLDSAGHAGRLFDGLAAHFGAEQVFMDVDDLEPGQEIAAVVAQRLKACRVALVVIGRSWASVANADGTRRLDDPRDLVRLEIETALRARARVIPVLVGGAPMPKAAELPGSLAVLAGQLAHRMSDERWAQDLERLLRHLGSHARSGALEGTWLAQVAAPEGKSYELLFHFTSLDEALAGSVVYPTGEAAIVEGSVQGQKIAFTTEHHPQFSSTVARIRFHGKRFEDRLELMLQSSSGSAKFLAHPVRDPAS